MKLCKVYAIIIVNIAYNIIGVDIMATKSFLKNITIKSRKDAEKFLKALENAENKQAKVVKFDKRVEEIKDSATIKKMFSSKG